ncbi:hypothetical protein ABZW50_14955 [Streptomyces bacillaris]
MTEKDLTEKFTGDIGGSDEQEAELIEIRLLDKIETIQNKRQDG